MNIWVNYEFSSELPTITLRASVKTRIRTNFGKYKITTCPHDPLPSNFYQYKILFIQLLLVPEPTGNMQ